MAEFNYDDEVDEIITDLKGLIFDMDQHRDGSLELMSSFARLLVSNGKLLNALVEREHLGRDDGEKIVGRLANDTDVHISQIQAN